MPTLYHFTSRLYLPSILRTGINKGDVATEPERGFNAPWLTKNPSFTNQGWDRGGALDKLEVRLTVEIPEDDDKLWSWSKLVETYGIEDYWVKALTHQGRDRPHDWFAYMGSVSPMLIANVEERTGLGPLDLSKLPPMVTRLHHEGDLGEVVLAVWRSVPKAEFLAEMLAEPAPWTPPVAAWGVGKSSG